jgi:hypothetical protein
MKKLFASAIVAGAVLSAPAFANNYNEEKAVCANAVGAELGKPVDEAIVFLKKVRDRRVMRVTVLVKFPDGQSATAECFIRKGEVEAVNLEA